MKHLRLAIGAAVLLLAAPVQAGMSVDLMIDTTGAGPEIARHLYGQVAVPAGSGQASQAWVGPGSPIPNTKGWRKDVVAAFKDLAVPLVRWPAGCLADDYNWRDGIGPAGQRPVRSRVHRAGQDNNAVGTHEMFDLIEAIGAEAYFIGNVGTGSPREAAEWVEYMGAETASSLARMRARNGRAKPFKLSYFGVGHAPWDCGGNMTPQYYADLYNQYAVFIRGKSDKPPKLVASGRSPDWTAELSLRKRIRDYRDRIAAHDGPESAMGEAPQFPAQGGAEERWAASMHRAWQMDALITSHLVQLDRNDPVKKVSMAIGEWSTRDGGAQSAGSADAQHDALRDALAAALHFHIFHAHAARVSMASFSPALHAGRSLILTEGAKIALTPTYHAFRMHVPFQGAQALPVTLARNLEYTVGGVSIPALSASAARGKDGKLYLSVVNAHPHAPIAVAVALKGMASKGASGSVLTASDMDAHNSTAVPHAVRPAPLSARADQGRLQLTLAPKSVTVVAIDAASDE